MWSDRLSASSRQALVERLRGILPAPREGARLTSVKLHQAMDAAEWAGRLWHAEGFAWLDGPRWGRIFVDPVARLSARGGEATVSGPGGEIHLKAHGFDLLEAALEAWRGAREGLLCGYLGYELGGELEDVPQPEARAGDLPDLDLGLYDWRLEQTEEGWQFCGTDAWRAVGARDAEGWLKEAPEEREDRVTPVVSSVPNGIGYQAAVARTVQRIYAGELFQVNLCRRLETPLPEGEIWALYTRLRAISPADYGALIRAGGESAVLSVSPELFLSVRGGQVRSCPIKGTRARGETAEEDQALARALRGSEKDRAELAMIVDVTRNDLGRVCRPGSVAVARHAELMTLPTVHHTYSEVTGALRAECGTADLLRACFPPASITGAPKIRAMQLAAEEEGFRRGPSMGAMGWMSLDGDAELSVGIRTAMASEGRVWYLAGCGITAESNPAEELAESEAKAAAFLRALAPAATRSPESVQS